MIMGSNMAEAARTMVIASMTSEKNENEQKVKLFLRFYSNDFSSQEREDIVRYLKGKNRKNPKPEIKNSKQIRMTKI